MNSKVNAYEYNSELQQTPEYENRKHKVDLNQRKEKLTPSKLHFNQQRRSHGDNVTFCYIEI